MDTVFVRDLKLRGAHGVLESEWVSPQEFIVDAAVELDLRKATDSDMLEDTVCWTSIEKAARSVIEGPAMHLIERIAVEIADRILLGDSRIARVSVTVRKSEISVNGTPGVSIVRSR